MSLNLFKFLGFFNLTLKAKMMTGFGTIIIITIFGGMYSYFKLDVIRVNQQRVLKSMSVVGESLDQKDKIIFAQIKANKWISLVLEEKSLLLFYFMADDSDDDDDDMGEGFEEEESQSEDPQNGSVFVRTGEINIEIQKIEEELRNYIPYFSDDIDELVSAHKNLYDSALDLITSIDAASTDIDPFEALYSFNAAEKNLKIKIDEFEDLLQKEGLAQSDSQKMELKSVVDDVIHSGSVITNSLTMSIFATLLITVLAIFIGTGVTLSIVKPIQKVTEVIAGIGKGNLDSRLHMKGNDEIGKMAGSIDKFADELKLEVLAAFENLAAGNFTFEAKGVIKSPLQKANSSLNELITRISVASDEISIGTSVIANSSNDLSQGANQQAQALKNISVSLYEMGEQTTQNASKADQANRLVNNTMEAAEIGNKKMEGVVLALKEIDEAGKSSEKVIKVINEIAFQTNLLALNAAVEAARAGKHGRGFAVVAEEVRNLAARSATASTDTADLIKASMIKAQKGSLIVNETATSLLEMLGQVRTVATLVSDIAEASKQQAAGLAQVNEGLNQIGNITQTNTTSATEIASAAAQQDNQANALKQMMSLFKIKKTNTSSKANEFIENVHQDKNDLWIPE